MKEIERTINLLYTVLTESYIISPEMGDKFISRELEGVKKCK